MQAARSEAPRSVLRAFVAATVLGQVSLLAAALGAMLVGFRNQWTLGGAVAAAGLVTLGGVRGVRPLPALVRPAGASRERP